MTKVINYHELGLQIRRVSAAYGGFYGSVNVPNVVFTEMLTVLDTMTEVCLENLQEKDPLLFLEAYGLLDGTNHIIFSSGNAEQAKAIKQKCQKLTRVLSEQAEDRFLDFIIKWADSNRVPIYTPESSSELPKALIKQLEEIALVLKNKNPHSSISFFHIEKAYRAVSLLEVIKGKNSSEVFQTLFEEQLRKVSRNPALKTVNSGRILSKFIFETQALVPLSSSSYSPGIAKELLALSRAKHLWSKEENGERLSAVLAPTLWGLFAKASEINFSEGLEEYPTLEIVLVDDSSKAETAAKLWLDASAGSLYRDLEKAYSAALTL